MSQGDQDYKSGMANGPAERGPNYNWEMEARHYENEYYKTLDVLDKIDKSAEKISYERDQLKSRIKELESVLLSVAGKVDRGTQRFILSYLPNYKKEDL